MSFSYWAGRPRRLGRMRRRQVATFLAQHAGSGLTVDQLRRRLRRLRWILLMFEGDRLIGTVALKPVNRRHQRRSFRTAGVALKPSWRRSELGFLCIDPAFRGQGLSFRIMQEARDRGCRPTYSVTGRKGVREMNLALGMVQHGTPWQGRKEQLTLWTWDEDTTPPLEPAGES